MALSQLTIYVKKSNLVTTCQAVEDNNNTIIGVPANCHGWVIQFLSQYTLDDRNIEMGYMNADYVT